MPGIDVGRICVKTTGREAGKKCVVVDVMDKNFALVTGPKSVTGVKRRRTNMTHLEPTAEKIEVKRGIADDELAKALEKSKKTSFMKEKVAPKLRSGA